MRIEYLKREEFKKIKSLSINYNFNPYRNYRILNKESQGGYFLKEISDSLDQGDHVIIAKNKKRIIGLISVAKLLWDTAHFGIKMAKINYLIAEGSYQESRMVKKELLSFAIRQCKTEGIEHLSCKVDTSDYSSAHCLEEKYFKLMDTILTYIILIKSYNLPNLKELYKVRGYNKRDLNSLIAIVKPQKCVKTVFLTMSATSVNEQLLAKTKIFGHTQFLNLAQSLQEFFAI
ncbi:MAG: hypothetical protein KKC39_00670, partial [Candidatus Omnitrophica bacterium]|nr:hypothetical protein [Candidatus Omnitrophota bacterium]MCG2707106.1 hypothetical protein [Candidatus Omnitrophota bacterium]